MDQVSVLEQKCWADAADNQTRGSDTCNSIMAYIKDVSAGVGWYDARIFSYDWDPLEKVIEDLFTKSSRKEDMQKILHLQNSTRSPLFSFSSSKVKEAYKSTFIVDYSFYYNYLIELKDYPFIIMVGEFDMQDGYKSQVNWMKELLDFQEDFWH